MATRIVVVEGEDTREEEEVVTEEEGAEADMLTVVEVEEDTPAAVEVAATKEAEEVMIETWTCVYTSIYLLLINLSYLLD